MWRSTRSCRGRGGPRDGPDPAAAQWSGKQRLGGISKRGNRYVRALLVHCARTDLERLTKRSDGLGSMAAAHARGKAAQHRDRGAGGAPGAGRLGPAGQRFG